MVGADAHLTLFPDVADPNLLCQEGIDALQIEEQPFEFGLKRSSRKTGQGVNAQGGLALTVGGLDGQFRVRALTAIIPGGVQGGHLREGFVFPGQVPQGAVAPFDRGLVCGTARATGHRLNVQAQPPQRKPGGEV